MMDIHIDGAIRLAEAILRLCVKDYKRAMRMLQKNPGSYRAKDDIGQIEAFFHSQLFGAMVDVDPDYVIQKLREDNDDCKGIFEQSKMARPSDKR